ncbi:hypothetical protein [Roseomonas sp. BN140053]|uniref:hypothetical protein n=1 Tax=Roseomonas sp. BN140053 TaxID=3391898 RepID=UPI0039EC193E
MAEQVKKPDQAPKPERVFKKDIGKWPAVYQLGPNSYEVVARYSDPRRITRMIFLSHVPPALLAVYMLLQIDKVNFPFIFAGVLGEWMVIFLLLRNILTDMPFLIKTTTRIKFEGGRISWGEHVIRSDIARQFRSDRHRRAASEMRTQQGPQGKSGWAIYQFSTEVFIDTGEGWMHNRLVAEIADDESGEWGHMLSSTLRFVDRQSRAAVNPTMRATAHMVEF